MIFWCLVIFLWVGQSYSMQTGIDPIEQDYEKLTSFIMQMIERTKENSCPAELLSYLKTSPDINNTVPCRYCSATEHLSALIKKQTIRMACDFNKECGDKTKMSEWFIPYFKREIVPRMIVELKKERDALKAHGQCGSSGV